MEKESTLMKYDYDTIDVYDIWLAFKNKKWLVITTTFVFLCLSIAYAVFAPNVYKVSNILVVSQDLLIPADSEFRSQNYSAVDISEIKSALSLLEDVSKKQLALVLGIDTDIIETFKDFSISDIESPNPGINNAIKIDVNTHNAEHGSKILDAMVSYINTLTLVREKTAFRKTIMEKNRDELKKILEDPVGSLKMPPDTVVSEILISQYKLREHYNNTVLSIQNLEKTDVINLIGKTVIPERPNKPRRAKIVILGLFSGMFIGLFSAFLLEWFSSVRREHHERQTAG